MDDELASLRVEYGSQELRQAAAGSDPMALFHAWFEDARDRPTVAEPNAMSLATATADGVPSVRMVLLKDVDPSRAAFTWFTNLASRKAMEILGRDEPVAALAWWWPGNEAVGVDAVPGRQVRAVGRVELVDRDATRAYFESRPLAARIGAIASHQSQPVLNRSVLEARADAISDAAAVSAADATVPDAVELPDGWGGLRLIADELEFWQGRAGRLHDRVQYLRSRDDIEAPTRQNAALPDEATSVTDAAGTTWHRMRLEP